MKLKVMTNYENILLELENIESELREIWDIVSTVRALTRAQEKSRSFPVGEDRATLGSDPSNPSGLGI